jgi:hypothetical protein
LSVPPKHDLFGTVRDLWWECERFHWLAGHT